MPETVYKGGCHCGAVSFEFKTRQGAGELFARRCSCSFCTKHGATYVADPEGELDVFLANPDSVNRYRFGHGTADFMVCAVCGVTAVALSEIEGRSYGIVNANTISEPPFEPAAPDTLSHDGEDPDGRLARRARNWIGTVRVAGAD